MKTEEIVRLTRKRVAALVKARQEQEDPDFFEGGERRENFRWPFPGAVELWPAGGDGRERWYATCRNLSMGGLGMAAEQPFEAGNPGQIPRHFPHATPFRQAVGRHFTPVLGGFLVRFGIRLPSLPAAAFTLRTSMKARGPKGLA